MKNFLLSAMIAVIFLGGFATTAAGESAPIATIAFSGYDELMTDIECIGKLSGQQDLVKMLNGLIAMQTQGRGLAGLDTTRPWGVVVLAVDGPVPDGYGFIPVSRLEELIDVLKHLGVDVSNTAAGSYKLSGPNAQEFYIKQKGSWAYVCMNEAGFADVADDPAKLLGDAAARYNFSARLSLKNVPPALREMAIRSLQMGMKAGKERMPGESEEVYQLRMQVSQHSIDQTRKMFEQLDGVLLGIAVDEKTGSAFVDLELTAVDGSEYSKQLSAFRNGRTNFGGFYLPQDALTACTFATLDEIQKQQSEHTLTMYHAMLVQAIDEDQSLDEENKSEAKRLMDEIIMVLRDTIASGEIDMGAALALAPARSTLIAGTTVADAVAVDQIVRELAHIAKSEYPQTAHMFKLDVGAHAGVRFHTLDFPLPEMKNSEKVAALLGDRIKLVLGVGEKRVYLGVGEDALEKLKAAIDLSDSLTSENVQPLRISLSATPVAKLAGELSDEFMLKIAASSVTSALEGSDGEDHITLVGESVANGVCYRLTFEKGILKILGMLPTMMTMSDGI